MINAALIQYREAAVKLNEAAKEIKKMTGITVVEVGDCMEIYFFNYHGC
jgi:hypothetical protein